MRAMTLERPGPIETAPLRLEERETPAPAPGEVLVRVEVCGVCRTDLHVVEGDLPPRREKLVPGHQVVGRVAARGAGAERFRPGDRVGIAWLRRSCGACRFCASGAENLCLEPRFTGWDADGGYADFATAPEEFAYALPSGLSARAAAPLLCAGIIGYRAYRRSGVEPGGRLGLFGFGGSAHIAIQVARHFDCEVYVFSRGGEHRELAEELGAAWVGGSFDPPPHKLDGAILFAPAGELVPPALEALDRGATLAIAGIHLSPVPPLDYQRHLFQERSLCSVTANTREDGRELLELAARIPIRTHTTAYPLEAANRALADLEGDRVRGAAVLVVGAESGEPGPGPGPVSRGPATPRSPVRVLALDFDGVISDSAPEAFVVALRTWSELRPGDELDGAPDWLRRDALPEREQVTREPLYASFLELMPLGNRAEDYGVVLQAIAAGRSLPDQEAYDRHKARIDPEWLRRFHKHFYRVRAAAHESDPEGWHRLMGPYPALPALLRRLAGRLELAVATAKDRGSVARLLSAYGIDDLFAEGRVLDKDTGVSKRAHLEHLHRQLGAPYAEMAFVDDKVNHLDAVAPLGVACGLAAWGYNGSREVALARRRGHAVLEPDDLEAWLLGERG